MKLWYSIIHHALLLLEIVEKRFSFACPAGVKVPIRQGDCKIKDANVYNAMTNKVSEDHPKNMTTWERGDNNAENVKDLVGYGLGDTSQRF